MHVARSCTRCRTCLIRRMECRPNRLRRTMQKTGSMVLITTAGWSIIRCAVCGQTLLCNKPIEPNPASVALEGVGSVLQAIVKVKGALEAVEANKKSCGRLAAQWARMDECLMTRCAAAADVHDAVADLKLGVTGDERCDKVDREGEKVDVEEQEDAELGRGRFATTYRMRHSIDGRLCAVKAKRDLSSHQKRPI